MIFLLRMYLLPSTHAYRFSLQECRHSCRFPMGEKLLEPGMASETHSGIPCQEQAVQASLPASPISGHCSIRYRNIPISYVYAGIRIFGQTCTLQDPANLFLRMRAYAYHPPLPALPHPVSFWSVPRSPLPPSEPGFGRRFGPGNWRDSASGAGRLPSGFNSFQMQSYVFAYVGIRILNGLEHVGILR